MYINNNICNYILYSYVNLKIKYFTITIFELVCLENCDNHHVFLPQKKMKRILLRTQIITNLYE